MIYHKKYLMSNGIIVKRDLLQDNHILVNSVNCKFKRYHLVYRLYGFG